MQNPFASGQFDMDTGMMAGQGFLNKAAQGLGRMINQNPAQFAIGADMVGRNLAPNNMFAGVGTHMGQGSIANKAAEQEQNKMNMLQKLIEGLTLGDQPGGNKLTIKKGPEGNFVVDTSINLSGLGDLTKSIKPAGPDVMPYRNPAEPNVDAAHQFLDSIAVRR